VAAAAAAAAVNAAPAKDMADAATAMIQALPRSARQQTIGRLVPDQHATNKIWMWIVITFAIVLGASIVALIGAIFVSACRAIDGDCARVSPALLALRMARLTGGNS